MSWINIIRIGISCSNTISIFHIISCFSIIIGFSFSISPMISFDNWLFSFIISYAFYSLWLRLWLRLRLWLWYTFSFLSYYLFLLFHSLINGESALSAHLTILVNDTMNASFAHGLTIVNMLRRKGAILAKKHFYEEKCHCDSNY